MGLLGFSSVVKAKHLTPSFNIWIVKKYGPDAFHAHPKKDQGSDIDAENGF